MFRQVAFYDKHILLKIPIFVIQDPSEKTNRAKLLNQFFQPILPRSMWKKYIPFLQFFDTKNISKLGMSGLLLNKNKTFNEILWLDSTPYTIEEYLLAKGKEFLDSNSQQVILQTEFTKLEPILQRIQKHVKNWGSMSGMEIIEKFSVFGENIPHNELLMEILQILHCTDASDISHILIDKRNRKVSKYAHKLLKQPKFESNLQIKKLSKKKLEKNVISYLRSEYGNDTLEKLLHAVLLKIPTVLIHDPYDSLDKAKLMNDFLTPILPIPLYNGFLPFIRIFDSKDLEQFDKPRLIVQQDSKIPNIPWIESSYIFEIYLLEKLVKIGDSNSQSDFLKKEFEKLTRLFETIKRKMESWGSISDQEIIEMSDDFDENLQKEELLIQILQILKNTSYLEINKILISKKYKKAYKFHHKLLKTD